jgi:maleylpyruvate isomerase
MTDHPIRLHGYFRSSASWRVRIALHLKGLAYETVAHDLRIGEQRSREYLKLNPQGLVPALEIDGLVLTQAMAICEYLDETHPDPPLLPGNAAGRARARMLAMAIVCDTHPAQNLRVLKAVAAIGGGSEASAEWARRVNDDGLAAFAEMVGEHGQFCLGDAPGLADIALVPQIANARRYGVDLRWPRLLAIEQACLALPAFRETAPDRQPDFAE